MSETFLFYIFQIVICRAKRRRKWQQQHKKQQQKSSVDFFSTGSNNPLWIFTCSKKHTEQRIYLCPVNTLHELACQQNYDADRAK